MKYLIIVLLTFYSFTSFCQDLKQYTLELDIKPSFLESKDWILQRQQKGCILNGMQYDFKNKKDALLIYYFKQLDTIVKNYKCYDLSFYVYKNGVQVGWWSDGTMTYGTMRFSDTTKTFNFHCGNIDFDSNQVKLIDMFFNITFYLYNKTNLFDKLTVNDFYYLEKLEPQVGRNAIRQVSEKPLTYRLFDRVYTFNYKSVMHLLDNLPDSQPVIIEVGKYFNINKFDEFLEPFKNYIQSRKNIIWIASGSVKEDLISLGLKKEYLHDKKPNKKYKTQGITSGLKQ